MTRRETILGIIKAHTGCTGAHIYCELARMSRLAAWFGPDSLMVDLFGPSFGSIYVHLAHLEATGFIRGEWVEGPYPRRRIYKAVGQ